MGNSTKPNRQNSNDSNGSQNNNNNNNSPAMRLNNTFSGANYNTVSGGRDRRQSNLRKVSSLQNLKRRWIHKTGHDIGNIMRLNQHSPDEIYALKNDQLTMLSNETQLNFSSIDDYYRLFVNICQDRTNDNSNPSQSNTLDRRGFIKLYCLLMEEPEEKTHSIASLTFESLQKDSFGRVNFNEFLIRYVKISRGTIKDKSECTYAIYDIDRKGYVELKDIKRAIRVMMPRMESNSVDEYERLSVECMNFLDVRKIGRISKDEFIEGLAENYVMRSVMCPYI